MNYGYARVSTIKQGRGNSLEEQLSELFSSGCDEVIEEKFSGKTNDRPQLKLLLDKLKEGDTFTVTKLDRFARSLIDGTKLVQELLDRGIKINILNIGVMDNTPASKLIRNIFLSFAEFERDMIVERTKEGKAIARQREDFTEGRPQKYSNKQIKHAIDLKQSGMSYKQVTEVTGISKATLIRRMKEYQ